MAVRPDRPRGVDVVRTLLLAIAMTPGITRAGLADATGLSRTAISPRIDDLLRGGALVEREGTSSGGRPPTELALSSGAGVLLCADIGATRCGLAVTDLAGRPIAGRVHELDITEGPDRVLAAVDDELRALLAGVGLPVTAVRGVGIGVPAPVRHPSGTIVRPPLMPGWDGFEVRDFFRARHEAAVAVDNDVNLMALGEYWAADAPAEHLLYVKMSTGIGCGVVSGGRLHRGATGGAGDIGHIQLIENGPLCVCGRRGCLEAVAGGDALARAMREAGVRSVRSSRDVTRLAERGHPEALRVVREASRHVGTVLAALVGFWNPGAVIIGGPLAALDEDVVAGIRSVVYERALPLSTRTLTIEAGRLGERAALRGAAALAVQAALGADEVERFLDAVVGVPSA